MTQKLDIEMALRVGIKYDAAAKVYVGHCPALDIRSQGTTEGRALKSLEDAIQAFVYAAHKAGILDDVIEKVQKSPSAKIVDRALRREEYRPKFLPVTAPLLQHAFA